jgi:DGQHR domain-containing protein
MSDSANKVQSRYSVSLVTQGKHKFYTLTMHSETLAKTCFVSTRAEDPKLGFQRLLDRKRAQEIADYIDTGLGTIPNSIVLSAQKEAEFKVVGKGKTIQFTNHPKAFLILDGQHRVYGFSLAQTSLRVPVVIYNGLSRQDESRLFIDINTKQRPVPNELLLDIKRLAEYESTSEAMLRDLFDLFNSESGSPLVGLLIAHKRQRNKISRVTFNAATKPLISLFSSKTPDELYEIMGNYLQAFISLANITVEPNVIVNPIVFKGAMLLFKDIAQRVQDKHGKVYTVDNFMDELKPLFDRVKPSLLRRPGRSVNSFYSELAKLLKSSFTL